MDMSGNAPHCRDVVIEPVPPHQVAEAIDLVFSAHPAENRPGLVADLLAAVRSGKVSAEGLLQARREGRLVGAAWSVVMPGRTASVWAAQLVGGEHKSTAARLMDQIDRFLAARNVRLAQSLLEANVGPSADRLLRAGYSHAADLLYLASSAEQFPTEEPAVPLQFEPYKEDDRLRMERLLEATYAATLDCPALNGVCEPGDVLESYRHTGVFDPQRWLFVRDGAEDVGCLLLADHPGDDQWELVYMGLLPSVRGNAWGLDITRRAQWLTGRARRRRLVLAVDAKNEPATRMYASAGFSVWNRQSVLVKVFGG